MSVRATLSRARALIASPATWTKQTCARDAEGASCDPLSDDAVCWCSIGAVKRAVGSRDYGACRDVYAALQVQMFGTTRPGIHHWNDSHSHAEVLAAFDGAIGVAC